MSQEDRDLAVEKLKFYFEWTSVSGNIWTNPELLCVYLEEEHSGKTEQ
jgi:hypothetical protein